MLEIIIILIVVSVMYSIGKYDTKITDNLFRCGIIILPFILLGLIIYLLS